MNYQLGRDHSVILMSVRLNAPYQDQIEDEGSTIIYEGHDVHRTKLNPIPKIVDQPQFTPSGLLTENGKFHKAAQDYISGKRQPVRIRVYEKIMTGIWSYNGLFHLVDSWIQDIDKRKVFKFKLIVVDDEQDITDSTRTHSDTNRVIPSHVKVEVWRRDKGKCVMCGTDKDLHFDHIIPFSKGGSSTTSDNIQLLCSKHNLEKHDRIQ